MKPIVARPGPGWTATRLPVPSATVTRSPVMSVIVWDCRGAPVADPAALEDGFAEAAAAETAGAIPAMRAAASRQTPTFRFRCMLLPVA